ncbi:heavy metal translocating P-type ATPase [uncultured Parolsenella sp.]|uniref:heavy metal translocating P-type ATPase n=1 Tax=uncultured Parolsenella sp. TaxID=2083008 RepID=UPI0025D176CE|nr:heavy metal translocating P-type ATPase [uncultured Parolsenella sp.]
MAQAKGTAAKPKKKRRKKESQQHKTKRVLLALAIFFVIFALDETGLLRAAFGTPGNVYASFVLYLVPFAIAGHDVLEKAFNNIRHGKVFDENFLMAVATLGAFAMVLFPNTDPHMAEGAAVMLFYQVGELFQAYAVGKSRKSIADMMDIAPDYANVEDEKGVLAQVSPDDVAPGTVIVIKPGERVPIDGVIVEGATQLDTAALTGESVPRHAEVGADVISGCINMTGLIKVRTTKPFGESTVSRILELVENASEKKARTENFITRFARVYTPAVTGAAAALALIGGLVTGAWSDWILRGLTFLVVSCPCALVISVPLSFFGGIGGASRIGVLVKGSNYLEALSEVDTVVFDKTGTLTNGTFDVVAIHPEEGIDPDYVLSHAAYAEAFSDHPIAISVKAAYSGQINRELIRDVQEESGHGVCARIVDETNAGERVVLVGNDKLMDGHGISWSNCELTGTILHVSVDGRYVGHIVIADVVKDDAQAAIEALHGCGVSKTAMLTGDRTEVAAAVAEQLGIDEFHAQLLPADKVARVEQLISAEGKREKLAFVGDGINDAPVLTRADVGIAMGAMGSDAAIEAADVVLMDDKPSNIARAIRVARKTMRIVWQNIVFALAVKLIILVLAALGIANMWLAVFGDVGVAIIAILNAMRAMRVEGSR